MNSNLFENKIIKNYNASSFKVTLVVSEFNSKIIENLLEGAISAFKHYGGVEKDCSIYRVPGAFEIPGTINQVLKYQNSDAIIAIGAIIKGDTPHFDFVATESARGIAEISRRSDIPIINSIITTDNIEQAKARSIVGGANKGWDALEAAIQTIKEYKKIAIKS